MSKLDYIIEEANIINSTEGTKPVENPKPVDSGYLAKVTADCLNIRAGAGTNYKINGQIKDHGVYTIVETQGNWGRLKSGAGWICLDYTNKFGDVPVSEPKKSIDELAREVIRGDWRNGAERKSRLTNAGYDYNAVQKRVNQLV